MLKERRELRHRDHPAQHARDVGGGGAQDREVVSKAACHYEAECDAMISAAKKSGATVRRITTATGMGRSWRRSRGPQRADRRHLPHRRRHRRLLQARRLVAGQQVISGGIMYDWGVHLLEYSLQFSATTSSPRSVGSPHRLLGPQTKWKSDCTEDEGFAVVRFKSGVPHAADEHASIPTPRRDCWSSPAPRAATRWTGTANELITRRRHVHHPHPEPARRRLEVLPEHRRPPGQGREAGHQRPVGAASRHILDLANQSAKLANR